MDYLHAGFIAPEKALLLGRCGQIQSHYHHLLEAFYLIKGPSANNDDDGGRGGDRRRLRQKR